MNSGKGGRKDDWFDRAESFLAKWKDREAGRGEPFTPEAWRVLKLTTPMALALGHDAVGAEHLLGAILKVDCGKGSVALMRAGLTVVALREEIEAERGVNEEGKVQRRIPYTPLCRAILERATARIRGLSEARVGVNDLLLELLAEKNGLPARIFRKRGINVEEVKRAMVSSGT